MMALELALSLSLLMQVDGGADIVRREDLRSGFVGLLDLAEGFEQRPVRRRDLVDRDRELHAGLEIGDRRDAGRAEDFRPEIRVAEILLGDLADRRVGADDDFQILVVGRLRRCAAGRSKHRESNEAPRPLARKRTEPCPALPHQTAPDLCARSSGRKPQSPKDLAFRYRNVSKASIEPARKPEQTSRLL